MCIYFINPEKPLKKFDIYAMKKLQKYVHVLPVIGKADNPECKEIRELKLNLIEMAHLNNVKFFDIHTSLLKKLKLDGGKQLNYFLEDKNGPCPPFSLITY